MELQLKSGDFLCCNSSFKTSNYFCRLFRKVYGLSPLEYRKQSCNKLL
ncbi:AraC family transcriptional regulator [Sphingobacterium paludis]